MASAENWTRENIVWLAGILEGEGCFSEDRGGGHRALPRITLRMTDEDVVARIAEIAGCGRRTITKATSVRKTLYSWSASSRDAIALMYVILPFMHARRTAKILEVLEEWRKSGARYSRMAA